MTRALHLFLLLNGIAIGVVGCTRSSPRTSSPPVVSPAVPVPIDVHVLNGYRQIPADVRAWTEATAPRFNVFVTDAGEDAARARFFRERKPGIVILAGDWHWNPTRHVHYWSAAEDIGLVFEPGAGRQVILWRRPASATPQHAGAIRVWPKIFEDTQLLMCTGTPFARISQSDVGPRPADVDLSDAHVLLQFFGDHLPIIAWREPVNELARAHVLTAKGNGLFARFGLNRFEEPANPSVTTRWLNAVADLTDPDAEIAQRSAVAIALLPHESGPIARPPPIKRADGNLFYDRLAVFDATPN